MALFCCLHVLERFNLVLLALNLLLLLLDLRLRLSLLDLPILHRIADQGATHQAHAGTYSRAGAGISGDGADYRTGRSAAGCAVRSLPSRASIEAARRKPLTVGSQPRESPCF